MKRSAHLRLTLMATAIPATLAGCSHGPATGAVVQSVDECRALPTYISSEDCQAAYQQALVQSRLYGPRFTNGSQCNDQFGDCQADGPSGGVTYYRPRMGGFLVGYRHNGNVLAGYDGHSAALFRDRSGTFFTSEGDVVSRQTGAVHGARGRASPPTRAVTVSRRGFGSASAVRSSFGRSSGRGFHFGG